MNETKQRPQADIFDRRVDRFLDCIAKLAAKRWLREHSEQGMTHVKPMKEEYGETNRMKSK